MLSAGFARADSRIQVPEGCGSEPEWRAELARMVGGSAASPAPSTAEVQLEIVQLGPSEFELQLGVGGEQRVLRDPVCRVLWRSALVIAAAASRPEHETLASAPPVAPGAASPPVRPTVAAPSPTPASPAPPSQPQPSAPAPSRARVATPPVPARGVVPASAASADPAPAVRQRAPSRQRREPARAVASRATRARATPREATPDSVAADAMRLGASLAFGVSSGVVPGWGPALEVSLVLEQRPWAVALALRHWPEQGQTRDGRSVLVSATGGRAEAVFRVAPALDVRGGVELNRLLGEGSANVQGPVSDVAWQLAPTLGVNVITMDLGYLRLELGGNARLSLVRPRFEVTGFGTLYRAPPVGADAIIRGVLLFW